MTNISYDTALAEVKAIVASSHSSFTAGMVILPEDRKNAMFAVYAFCRVVDDIADDGETLEIRRQGLQEWREKISALFAQETTPDAITTVLAPAIKAYGLLEADFQAIIDGMAMDAAAPICAPDWQELDLYCDHVASAVGRISVHIFGDTSEQAMQVSYHLGRALQLTNILRDLAEDALRDRLYLPQELLIKHHIASRVPHEVLSAACLVPVCRDLAEKAKEHFDAANLAMRFCDAKAMRPAKIMGAYYEAIHDRLVAEDWQNLKQRVSLPLWQKLWLLIKVMMA